MPVCNSTAGPVAGQADGQPADGSVQLELLTVIDEGAPAIARALVPRQATFGR